MIHLLAACLFAFLPQQAESVGGVPYVKRETRDRTYAAMREALANGKATFGEWRVAAPFAYGGYQRGDFAAPQPPEEQLSAMGAGMSGPEFSARFAGKAGTGVEWKSLGHVEGRALDLHGDLEAKLYDYSSAYLYVPVNASESFDLPITLGSDDGVRVWLNGRLILENEAWRSLAPDSERLTLHLKQGLNHLLVKVTNHEGGFGFQLVSSEWLAPELDSLLNYYLDRDFPPSGERAHYRVMALPVPQDLVLEVGGQAFLSDGRPVVSTRRGDVWIVDGAFEEPPVHARYSQFATGLHEPLGAAVRREQGRDVVYVVQRGELTRLVDVDGDFVADRYETVCDAWGLSGNYHEFAFGPKFDREGNAWVTLNVGFCGSLGKAIVPWRGFAAKITPAGEFIPVCDGLRSPNGIGFDAEGNAFYVDNQGDWVATNRLALLAPKSWHGHPASLRWRDDLKGPDDQPKRADPVVWFPYKKMGQSAADVLLDDTGGKFGPFAGQLFVGDQMNCSVMRVALEQVDGVHQGACFPFLEGLDSGTNRLAFAADGSLFVGQTDRGWGSLGRKSYGLERVVYTGVAPFEVLSMHALPTGFELRFTADVDEKSALDPKSYDLQSYGYEYHADYGAPEDELQTLTVTRATLAGPRAVRLAVQGLRAGFVHELAARGVQRRGDGAKLLHSQAYYTLVRIPSDRQPMLLSASPAPPGEPREVPELQGAQSTPQSPPGPSSAAPAPAEPRALPKVLFLSHSAGFVHDVVKRPSPGELSFAEQELVALTRGVFDVVATQDCAALTAKSLPEYAAVVFYTTGELPIPAQDREAFMAWMLRGGAFVGIHCATDTFYEYAPYLKLVGGVFDGHPWHQEVRVDVIDGAHPATALLERGFLITDEIYQFRDYEKLPLRELLRLEPSSVDIEKGKRADKNYALSWCREYGQGRMFYTALGHRPEVWLDARFRSHLLGGLTWAIQGGDWQPESPQYAAVLTGDRAGLRAWRKRDDSAPGWLAVDGGAIEAVPGAGDVVSIAQYGDADFHVEFAVPKSEGAGEARGNSGVYLMGRYELQVLDSFGMVSGKGDCGALYGLRAPDVNASKPATLWQSFDGRLRAPRFGKDGKKTENARLSLWHNGVLVHDDVELPGATPGGISETEVALGPLLLQEHGHAVRYRNVWVTAR